MQAQEEIGNILGDDDRLLEFSDRLNMLYVEASRRRAQWLLDTKRPTGH